MLMHLSRAPVIIAILRLYNTISILIEQSVPINKVGEQPNVAEIFGQEKDREREQYVFK